MAQERTRLTAEERRRRLLEAAGELFGEKGYRRTEVEEIARRAGVTKPMVYRHFPGGKADVFMAVLDGHIALLLRRLWEAMASSNEPRQRLHRGLDAYLRYAEEHPEGFHLMVDATAEVDPVVGERLQQVRALIANGLANTIGDVMKGAGLGADGAPIYAYALLGGVESVVAWWLGQGPLRREAVVDYLLAFVWRGFDGLPRDPTRLRLERAGAGEE